MTVTNQEMAFLEELLLRQLVISIENLYKNTASIQMSEDEAAIITAAKIGPIEVCEKLLELPNLKVNMTHNVGVSALMLAALKGDKGLVDNLINCPEIDINGTDMTLNQNPALWYAVAPGHKEIVGMFLGNPAIDINKASKTGTTALTTAVKGGDTEIVRILLKCSKVEINKMKNDFEDVESALWLAADAGHKEIVGMLLEHPAIDVNKAGRCRVAHRALNKTALDNAVARDQRLVRSGLSNEVVQDQKEIVGMLLQYSETSAIQIFIQHSYKKKCCNKAINKTG